MTPELKSATHKILAAHCSRLPPDRCVNLALPVLPEAVELAKKQGAQGKLQTGAVTLIQRFGGSIDLNPHFHMLVLDEAYAMTEAGKTPQFHWIENLSDGEVADLVKIIAIRVVRYLKRQGHFRDDEVWRGCSGLYLVPKTLNSRHESPCIPHCRRTPIAPSQECQAFVESLNGKPRLVFLPPYSPELNPDELVWKDVKNNGVGRKMICSPADLERAVHSRLRLLRKNPEKVRALFQEKSVRYAAA